MATSPFQQSLYTVGRVSRDCDRSLSGLDATQSPACKTPAQLQKAQLQLHKQLKWLAATLSALALAPRRAGDDANALIAVAKMCWGLKKAIAKLTAWEAKVTTLTQPVGLVAPI